MSTKALMDYLRGELAEDDWEYLEIARSTVTDILDRLCELWNTEDDLK